MTRPIWFFYHVPKTGGQTIRDHLAAGLGLGTGYLHIQDVNPDFTSVDQFTALSDDAREAATAIGGHTIEAGFSEYFPGRPVHEMVVVRDPAERLISLYNFTATTEVARGQPIPDFETFIHGRGDEQTKALVNRLGVRRSNKPLSDVLHRLTRMAFVGRTEDLDRALPTVFRAIGISPVVRGRTNVTGREITRYLSLTPELATQLRAESPLDVMLHAAAGRLQDVCFRRLQSATH